MARRKREIDEASGVTGWTLHDLETDGAQSLMARAGVPSEHAERCLGHVISGVEGVYDRHQYRDGNADCLRKAGDTDRTDRRSAAERSGASKQERPVTKKPVRKPKVKTYEDEEKKWFLHNRALLWKRIDEAKRQPTRTATRKISVDEIPVVSIGENHYRLQARKQDFEETLFLMRLAFRDVLTNDKKLSAEQRKHLKSYAGRVSRKHLAVTGIFFP